MLRYKAFHAGDTAAIEQEINSWLLHSEPDVKMMEQSLLPSGAMTVSFLYDEGFRASEHRLSIEANEIVANAMKEEPILEPIKVDQEQV